LLLVEVVLGSALGGMARFWVADAVARQFGERFPWGTLAVNASGALALGTLAAPLLYLPGSTEGVAGWHFAALGFLGSYTTVSTFSLQTLALVHDRRWRSASCNIVASIGVCLAAAWIGLIVGAWLTGLTA
jgi:fluoride exporter